MGRDPQAPPLDYRVPSGEALFDTYRWMTDGEGPVMRAQRQRRLRRAAATGVALSLVATAVTTQVVPPPATAAAALTLSVDPSAARHQISPDIYGLNGAEPAFAAEIGLPVARWGGNAS